MRQILVVDDAELILALQRSFLKSYGCEVLTATTGPEALTRARDSRPDVVILDADMADSGGLECCRILKNDPELRDIPVVFIGRPMDFAPCTQAGGDGFVTKPVTRERLVEGLRRFVPLFQRASPRRAVDVEVRFSRRDGHGVGSSKDVCAEGIFLWTPEALSAGESLRLSFELDDGSPVVADGTVVRTAPPEAEAPELLGFAIRFGKLSARQRLSIERFVERGGVEAK